MTGSNDILRESAARLFKEFAEPKVWRAAEEGAFPDALWARIAEQGLDRVFAGASDDPWRDGCIVAKEAGRAALAAPLAETLMASATLSALELESPEGALGFAPGTASSLAVDPVGRVSGAVTRVPWGRAVAHLVTVARDQGAPKLVLLETKGASVTLGQAVSREPRDTLSFEAAKPLAVRALSGRLPAMIGALVRAAQMAGAADQALALALQYARDRVQFGKPIASFQAIQHSLAVAAGHAAAAGRAADAAFDRIAGGADHSFEAAIAKIRCGEAAGAVAQLVHQAFGAIGFTDEHQLHYLTRRLWTWRSEFGSEAVWAGGLGARIAATGAEGFWPAITAAG